MKTWQDIAASVEAGQRLSAEDALILWQEAPLWRLGELAVARKREVSGEKVFYNRNFHLEPTNVCVFNCKFCSFRRPRGSAEAWEWSMEQMQEQVRRYVGSGVTEVHIVGGVHPDHSLDYYCSLIRNVKAILPDVAVKAYTAIELSYMIQRAGLSVHEGLRRLIEAGMDAIPGGGAEIFDEEIRAKICPDKGSTKEWFEVHRTAHELGLKTNATMLYGHIEGVEHRIDHLMRLRELQDVTKGFNAFIPLKYRNFGNSMSEIGEVPIVDDLRTLAMSRLILDNVPHIKAYWVMYGKQTTEVALKFGADDIDGTIDVSTKIYSMAGAEDKRPKMSVGQMLQMVERAGFCAVERDTHYNEINNTK
jgi:aminodeoxyfutalosine synthase